MKQSTQSQVKGLSYNHAELYPNKKMLSSSQVLTYEESPEQFHIEYVMEIRRPTTNAMHIGKVFSAMYADRKFNWKQALKDFNNGKGIRPYRIYETLERAIALFPVLSKKECEYPLKCKYRGWTFRATLDGYHIKGNVDIENKTGQVEWTQQRADESDQITFQYWCKWRKDKDLFAYCLLNWVDLRANATQLVRSFKTERNIIDVAQFEKRIDRVIDGIEAEVWQ